MALSTAKTISNALISSRLDYCNSLLNNIAKQDLSKLQRVQNCALAIHQPPYLASLLHFSNIPTQLRSSTSHQLYIPRTKLNPGKRALSVAAPIIWNELPTTLKSCESLASFLKNLKTNVVRVSIPSSHVRLGISLPHLPCRLPSIVLSRVS